MLSVAFSSICFADAAHITNPVGTWQQSDGVVAVVTFFRTRDQHVREAEDGWEMPEADRSPATARILFVNSTPEPRAGLYQCFVFYFGDVGTRVEEPIRYELGPGEAVEQTIASNSLDNASSMRCSFVGNDQ